MQRPRTDTGSPGPWWGKEEQTESVYVLLMTRTGVFHYFRVPVLEDNFVSCVQASGNGKTFSALAG